MFGKPSATTRRIWTVVATLAVCFALLPMAPALAATAYQLSINDIAVTEGTSPAAFTVSLNTPVGAGATVTVNYATADGTAAAPGDYTAASGPLTFAAGEQFKTVNVTVINDTVDEAATETYSVLLSGATLTGGGAGDTVALLKGTGVGTITDNDAAPIITVSSPAALEAGGFLQFTLTLSNPSALTVTASYTTAAGTATPGTDYTTTTGFVNFAPGVMTQTVAVPIIDDLLDENNETVLLNFGGILVNASGFTPNFGTILDDDLPAISFGPAPSAWENAGPVMFELILDKMLDPAVPAPQVQFATNNGTAIAGSDYNGIPAGICAFALYDPDAAGPLPAYWNCFVPVTLIDDGAIEADETFTLILSNPIGATIGTATGTGTIQDDDSQPTVSVNSPAGVSEGGAINFTVSLSGAYTLPITVKYQTTAGSAGSPLDYTALPLTTLTFAPGETSKTVSVTTIDDSLDEATETFTLNLSAPTNAKPGTMVGTGTILDNDVPVLNINSPAGIEENPSITNIQFWVSMAGGPPVAGPVAVNFATASGTAVGGAACAAGIDFVTQTGTLNWAIGDGSTKFIDIVLCDDALDEAVETFTVVLSGATGANIGTGTGTGTIKDDIDLPPALTILPSPAPQGENVTPLNFTVTLSAASAQTVTVNYATANGPLPLGALAGSDYTAAAGTLTFLPGETTKTIPVILLNDTLYEGPIAETFDVTLSSPTNASITLGGATATGSILDNDAPPVVSAANVSATEGPGTLLTFTLSLNHASYQEVRVDTGALLGAPCVGPFATSNVDFVDPLSWQTVVFAAGETSKTRSFTLLDDTLDEPNEFLCLAINGATAVGGTVAGGGFPAVANATGTIIDNDLPVVSVTPVAATATEASGFFPFNVTIDQPPAANVTVTFATANGTAVQPGDYTAVGPVVLTFIPAGPYTLTVWVPLIADALDEPNETFVANLSGISANAIISPTGGSATATIVDSNPPALSVSDAAVVEGTGAGTTNLVFTITASSIDPVNAMTVFYATGPATATSPADYTHVNALATIPAGALSTTFSVPIARDAVDEPDETLAVFLAGPTNATIGDGNGVGTIIDDDTVTASISNVSTLEGNVLTTAATFTVTLSGAFDNAANGLWINYATAVGGAAPATVGVDFFPASGILFFPEGGPLTQTFTVGIIGDVVDEADETYLAQLSANPANPALGFTTASGTGTILDDDPDTVKPVLTLPANMTVEATSPAGAVATYVATATDAPHANPPVTCLPASGSVFPFGTTTVNCSSTDASGNTQTGSFTITVVDTTPPVITLLGAPHVTVLLYGTYADDGATAFDNIDGDITAWIVTVNPVDTAMVGDYMVTYDVTDSHGNHAVQVTRMVHVVWACGGHEATIIGTAGADTLTGTPGDDVFMGLEGDDTIYGLGGNDLICGGPGNDMLYGGEGDDALYGNAGADMLYGEAGNDSLYGGYGNDRFVGGAGDDLMVGGTGFDLVDYSGAGAAMIVDLYAGSASGDGADSLLSFERLIGSAYDDSLIGGPADNTIWGGAGNDMIYGGGGNDLLYGQDGDDTLYGQGGDDALYGGPGDDTLIGGQGDDLIDSIPEGFLLAL